MIDQVQLTSIAADAPELLIDILNKFSTDSERSLNGIESASAQEGQDLCHQLSGASGTLGLAKLSERLRELELQFQNQESPEIQSKILTKLLKDSVREAVRLLESHSS